MRNHPVIGVVSGCGGAGASVFAAALAACAGLSVPSGSFLVDCDPLGGGIDVLLGCEQAPGARWSQVRLRGGELDPDALREGLPRWGPVSVLAADTTAEPAPEAVVSVVRAGSRAGPVIVDLPRWRSSLRNEVCALADLVVVVAPGEVRGLTASALVVAELLAGGLTTDRGGVVVRGVSRAVSSRQVRDVLGLPVLGTVPFDPASSRPEGLRVEHLRRTTRVTATKVLAKVEVPRDTGVAAVPDSTGPAHETGEAA